MIAGVIQPWNSYNNRLTNNTIKRIYYTCRGKGKGKGKRVFV